MRAYLVCLLLVCAVYTGGYAQEKEGRNPFGLSFEAVKEPAVKKEVTEKIPKISLATDGKKLSSMNFVDAEIGDVLRALAEGFQLNIVAGTDVKGKVTVSLNDVTLDNALASMLRVNGYDYVKKDNIIMVIKLGQPGVETESRVFTLNHVDAANIKASLSAMITQYGSIETMVRR